MLHAEYVDTTKDKIKGLEEQLAQHDARQEAIERRAAYLEAAEDAMRERQEEQRQKEEALSTEKGKLAQERQALQAAQETLAKNQERLQVGGRSCCCVHRLLSCTWHRLGLDVPLADTSGKHKHTALHDSLRTSGVSVLLRVLVATLAHDGWQGGQGVYAIAVCMQHCTYMRLPLVVLVFELIAKLHCHLACPYVTLPDSWAVSNTDHSIPLVIVKAQMTAEHASTVC